MATKKTTSKNKSSAKTISTQFLNQAFISKLLIVLLIGLSVFFLAKKYRHLFIVAMVDRSPISRWQLNQALDERYGDIVLDELVNQELINSLAKKQNVTVTEEEINQEIDNLKQQIGGDEVFKTTLDQYGLNLEQLGSRLKLNLLQRKLADSLFTPEVTEEETKEYYDANLVLFEDKAYKEVQAEIKDLLLDQKLQEQFNPWFQEQKEKASIQLFI